MPNLSNTSDARLRGQREQPESHQNGGPPLQYSTPVYINPQFLPGGKRSLAGISIRAYFLGIAFGSCSLLATQLAYFGYGLWRAPVFIAILAVFHYLEFDMTARHNPSDATLSSFLLLSNGIAYSMAHTAAMIELLLRYSIGSKYSLATLRSRYDSTSRLPTVSSEVTVGTGFFLVVVGQFVRSGAMWRAKANFNHIVQNQKKDDHVLITTGIYSVLRHPSYFGFFWWALGTQIVLGNKLCFVAYAIVLWRFFSHRIMHEEKHLIAFFGDEYIRYKQRTPVLIPFVS